LRLSSGGGTGGAVFKHVHRSGSDRGARDGVRAKATAEVLRTWHQFVPDEKNPLNIAMDAASASLVAMGIFEDLLRKARAGTIGQAAKHSIARDLDVSKLSESQQRWPMLAPEARMVLSAWSCSPGNLVGGSSDAALRKKWFTGTWFQGLATPELRELHQRAQSGEFDTWATSVELLERVSVVILLDQFPRSIYFGSKEQFCSDAKAREAAEKALADGRCEELPPVLQMWMYFPYLHSEENLADQEKAKAGIRRLQSISSDFDLLMKSAEAHYEAVRRFGRIPERNEVLGRETTPEEAAYLEENSTA